MIPVYTPSRIRSFDAMAIEELLVPSLILMENAAVNAFEIIRDFFGEELTDCAILCGKGNNGGDGYALARQFAVAGLPVSVFSLYEPQYLSPDARTNFTILTRLSDSLPNLNLVRIDLKNGFSFIDGFGIIVDAVLGSGGAGELQTELAALITHINTLSAMRVAIDIPTGVDAATGAAQTAFAADLTISLAGIKTGIAVNSGAAYAGEVVNVPIGIPSALLEEDTVRFPVEAHIIEPADAYRCIPRRDVTWNKYSAGKVLTVGGSMQYQGAGLLAATAAFYSGCGASVLMAPASIAQAIHARAETQLIIESYDDEGKGHLIPPAVAGIRERLLWADVVVLGPGVTKNDAALEAGRMLLEFAGAEEKLVVVDADGLAMLRAADASSQPRNIVITPHPGEFAQLISSTVPAVRKDLLNIVRGYAAQTGFHVLFKDFRSFYAHPEGKVIINSSGNSGLAKFGSGDVLSGVLAGLMAQHTPVEDSIIAAMYLHGLAADILAEEYTEYGYTAPQVMRAIPKAIKLLIETVHADNAL